MFGIFKKILSRFSPENIYFIFMSRLVLQTVIHRKKKIEEATMLLLTVSPFYGWIYYFFKYFRVQF